MQGSFRYEVEALRNDRAVRSVSMLETVGGVEGDIGGEVDVEVVTEYGHGIPRTMG